MRDAQLPKGMRWAGSKNVIFVHVPGMEVEETKGHYENNYQTDVVQEIVYRLHRYTDVVDDNIGIITPYRKQTTLLTNRLGSDILISTADAFQGSEKDIIILCTVRSNHRNAVGFSSNFQRLNVSITRAKKALIIVGNAHCLAHGDQSGMWWKYCKDHKEKKTYFDENLQPLDLDLYQPDFIETTVQPVIRPQKLSVEASIWQQKVFDHADVQVEDVFKWNRKDFSHIMAWAHLGFRLDPTNLSYPFVWTSFMIYYCIDLDMPNAQLCAECKACFSCKGDIKHVIRAVQTALRKKLSDKELFLIGLLYVNTHELEEPAQESWSIKRVKNMQKHTATSWNALVL